MSFRKDSKTFISTVMLFVFALFVFLYPQYAGVAFADSDSELQKQIDDKNKQLQELNQQISQTQNKVDVLQGQGRTLQNALKEIDYEIDQVGYGIRSSEINIDKLKLELESLGYQMEDVGKEIKTKEETVAEILREVQQKDNEGLLEILLKNETLADGVFEVQNLRNLQSNLSISVAQLSELQVQLGETIDTTETKKTNLENEAITLKSRKVILANQQEEKDTLLKETKNQENVYKQKLNDLEKIKAEVSDEIDRIESELRGNVNTSALPTARKGVLEVPVNGILTQGYGRTSYAMYTYKSKWHNGIDIGAPNGTPIIAAEDGVVEFTANQDAVLTGGVAYCRGGAYGKVVVIKHDNNLATLYAHMSLIIVAEGERVERGQLIGYVGRSGWATGPHIHFSVFDASTFTLRPSRVCGPMPVGGDLNPLSYMNV